jgi:hypothetical protein
MKRKQDGKSVFTLLSKLRTLEEIMAVILTRLICYKHARCWGGFAWRPASAIDLYFKLIRREIFGTVCLLNDYLHVEETPILSFQFMMSYFLLVFTWTTCLSLNIMMATDHTTTEPMSDYQNTRGWRLSLTLIDVRVPLSILSMYEHRLCMPIARSGRDSA